jgi:hypothetical protein
MFSEDINFMNSYLNSYSNMEISKKTKSQKLIDEVNKLLQLLDLQINSDEVNNKIKIVEDLLYKMD